MSRIPYFPLSHDCFEHQFGVQALKPGQSILERTASYDSEIALKQQLIEADQANYFQVLSGSEPSQREAANLLVGRDCQLIEAAVKIQEDVVLLDGDPESNHPIIAGVVCFPSGWTIAEKIGQTIDTVHEPVPDYREVMSRATNQLLQRIKPERPVWRTNWGVRASGQLDQSPKHLDDINQAATSITTQNSGSRCYFRVERQTLSRLPETGSILFTIHTHQCTLAELDADQRRILLGVIQTCPAATAKYKGFDTFADKICDFLST